MGNKTPYLITLHGLDETSPSYSEPLYKNMQPTEALFAPLWVKELLAPAENRYLAALKSDPVYSREHLKMEREWIAGFVGDLWQFIGVETQQILDSLLCQLANVPIESPAHLVLHSWGTCVFFDRRFAAFRYNRLWASVATLACPVGLYSLSGLTDNLNQPNWHNFWHSDDIIGTPMAPFGNAVDQEMTDAGPPDWLVGGGEVLLTGNAHNAYFSSREVAKYLKEVINKA